MCICFMGDKNFTKFQAWFNSNLLNKFKFYENYDLPSKFKTISELLEFIDNLPIVDLPQVFGLHSNADLTCLTKKAQYIIDTIVNLEPSENVGTETDSKESLVHKIVIDMLEKMPKPYLDHEVYYICFVINYFELKRFFKIKDQIKKMGSKNAFNIFLKHELNQMQKILNIVRTSLSNLKLAIEGVASLNEVMTIF